MKTLEEINDVLARVKFPAYSFRVKENTAGLYLQIKCEGKCNVTGTDSVWFSRKWSLSYHMTDGEIVQTAFKAVLTALEHEARELFTYRDVSIFDPHYDIEKLVELRKQSDSVVERERPVAAPEAIAEPTHSRRPMTSLWASLSEGQQKAVLAYDGPENHGSNEFRLPSTSSFEG
jgi:hypothetical protein